MATVDLRPKPNDPGITRWADPALARSLLRVQQPVVEPWYAQTGRWV